MNNFDVEGFNFNLFVNDLELSISHEKINMNKIIKLLIIIITIILLFFYFFILE